MKILCVLGLVVLASGVAAQDVSKVGKNYTAEDMLNMCSGTGRDYRPELQSIVCTFRIQGLSDLMIFNCQTRADGYDPASIFSMKPAPSKGSMRQVFKNYMRDNPQVWGEYWSLAVAVALSEAFPCEAD